MLLSSIQFDTKYMYGYKAEINNGTLFVASTANTEGTRLWEVDVIGTYLRCTISFDQHSQ